MPDFLIRMRHASKNYQSYKFTKEKETVSDASHISQIEQIVSEYNVENNKESETLSKSDAVECDIEEIEILTSETEESDESDEDTEDSIDEGRGLLRYFFFTKLFV